MRAAFANFAVLRQRDFALLWTAGLISTTGDAALFVAMPLHAYQVTGSAVASGAVFAAGIVPTLLFGSIAAVFVDRWDRKRTMVAADLLRALLLLPPAATSVCTEVRGISPADHVLANQSVD